MAAGAKFNIDITARDRTAEALKSVNDNMGKLTRGTPLEHVFKGFRELSERGEALGKVGKSLGMMGGTARVASGELSEAAGAASGLADAAGLVELGAVGVVGGLGAAAGAAMKFEAEYSKAGEALGFNARALDMNVETLQRYQIAGEKAGVTSEAMTQSFQGLATTMEDAAAGRNQSALMLMNKLGIQLHRNAEGGVDEARAMEDLGRAMEGQTPQVKQLIAAQFGAAGALNFLIETQAQREEQLRDADRSGAIRSQKQIDDDMRVQDSMKKMGDQWHGVLNVMSEKLIIPWMQPLMDDLARLAGLEERVRFHNDGKVEEEATLGDIFKGHATVDSLGRVVTNDGACGAKRRGNGAVNVGGSKAARAMAYFESQGWTREQAAGIVANIAAESGFNEHAVGDNGSAFGLGQWHADRQANFAKWARHGIASSTFEEQLAYYNQELTSGGERGAGNRLRRARSGREAGAIVSEYAERPGDVAGEASRRGAAAQHLVQVEINMKGAPHGTVVATQTSGPAVSARARVAPSLPGGSA